MNVKKILMIAILLLFSTLSFGKNYIGEISKLYTNENLVIGVTNKIRFTAELSIIKENGSSQDFFQLNTTKNNSFINLNITSIKNITGVKIANKIYFKNDSNNEGIQEIRFLVEGELLLNWLNRSRQRENMVIGYVNSTNNPVYLSINIDEFDPIYSLKIKVIDNMNLGKVEAGEKLSTKELGTPANISIEGEENKSVNIYIPNTTTITNSNSDSLTVYLHFRSNNGQKLTKKLSPNNTDTYRIGNDGIVVTKDILIDGEAQTKRTTKGVYRGSFTVKVEYLD